MRRYLRVLLFSMVAVGLIAGGVSAGTINTPNSGTPASIALEAMGAARNLTLSGASNNALSFTSARSLISGDLVNFTFTNVGMAGGTTFYLCQNLAAVPLDQITATANATSFSLRSNGSVSSGTTMFLSTNDLSGAASNTGNNCISAGIGGLTLRFQPVSSAAMATVAFNVTSFGTLIDTASAKNIGNISKQFSTAYGQGNSTIDFATNSSSNGTRFSVGNNATILRLARLILFGSPRT